MGKSTYIMYKADLSVLSVIVIIITLVLLLAGLFGQNGVLFDLLSSCHRIL